MKKICYIVLTILLLIISINKVSASSLEGRITFEKQDYLNIFYELNQQTALANYIMQNGFDLLDHLETLARTKYERQGEFPSGLNAVSLRYATETAVSGTYEKEPYYVITLYTMRFGPEFTTDGITINVAPETVDMIFSEDMEFLNAYNFYVSTSKFSLPFSQSERNITQLFSRAYFVASNMTKLESSLYDAINLSTIITDKDHYKQKDFAWLEWFARMMLIVPIGPMLKDMDLKKMGYNFEENLSLQYYSNNPVVSKTMPFKSLGAMLFEQKIVEGPSNFSNVKIHLYPYGVYLTPKSSCESDCDYSVYAYSAYGKVNLYSTSYQLGSKFIKNKDISYNVPNSFQLYRFDLMGTHELTDILNYTFMFTVPDKTDEFVLYYDPNSWNVAVGTDSSNGVIIKGADGTEYNLSKSDIYFNSNDSITSNNQNVNNNDSVNTDPGNFDFSASTVLNGFKKFIGSVSGIASAINSMFSNLPPELVALLYSGFTMGIIAMIIKIIL